MYQHSHHLHPHQLLFDDCGDNIVDLPLKDILEYVFAFKRACLPFNGASVVDVVGFVAPDEVGGLIFTAAE